MPGFFLSLLLGASTVVSTVAAIKQSQAQKKALGAQSRMEAVKAAESRKEAVRAARIQQASLTASAFGAGAYGSGYRGGSGSLTSQLGTNLGRSTQLSGISRDISRYSQDAARWQGIGAIGGLGMEVAYGGGSTFSDVFDVFKKKETQKESG